MTMIKSLFTVIVLAALSLRTGAQTVAPAGATNYDINTNVAVDTITVALKLDGIKFSDLKFTEPKPFSVRNGSSSDQRFFNGISFSATEHPPHVSLIVRPDLLDASGIYDVNLEYTVTATGKTGFLTFTLTRQAAVLAAPTVTIAETGCSLVSDQLLLRETGGKAGIRVAGLPPPGVPGIKKGDLITFAQAPVSIAPGGQQPIPLTIDRKIFEELPLGETKATMQITQKGLAAPLQVQFEIWNKRSKWWIVGIVIGGLALGFLVRHFLKDKRDYEQARLNAIDLIRDITTFTMRIEDPEFQSSVNTIISNLRSAIDGQSGANPADAATALNTATATAKTAYGNLKTTFQTTLQTEINAFYTLAGQLYDTDYEKPIRDRLNDATATLQQAKARLDAANPTLGTSLLNQATTQANADVVAYLSYSGTMITFF